MPDYRRRAAREAMRVRLDVNGMMAEAIGQAGVTREEVAALAPEVSDITRRLAARRAAEELAFYDLPYQKDDIARIKAAAAAVRSECDTLVVLGSGGSVLGPAALIEALGPTTPRVLIADSIDPIHFGALLDELDLARTTFNVISKSGETAETIAQFLIVRDLLLRQLGAVDYTKRVVITTDAEAGALRQVIHDEGFLDLTIPAAVGGRFSVLTAAGLFPAAVAGVRIDDLLAGAAWMDKRCTGADLWHHPAHLLGTILHLADTHRQQRIAVMMPYCDRLRGFTHWFAQLWVETLGKAETIDGVPAHVGQTPVAAAGATDQHALLQRVVVMLRVDDHGRELPIPAAYTDLDSIGYLGGTGLAQLLNLTQQATELALVKQQRPAITLNVPQINAFTLGQLFYLFEMAVVCAAALHRVDPLDQPRIQEQTRLTSALAGRKGFDDQRAEVEAWLARKHGEYIL